MRYKRSLFIILMLFLILFSTSFVCASDSLTHNVSSERTTLSISDDSVIDEGNSLRSTDDSSEAILGRENAQDTDEIENGSLTNDARLRVSNDEPVLGAEIHAEEFVARYDGQYSVQNIINEMYRCQPGDIIFLDGKTFTGRGDRHPEWGHTNLNGVTVYGGSYIGDTAMATLDNNGYTMYFSGSTMTDVTFENIRFTGCGIWDSGGGAWNNVVLKNVESSRQTFWLTGSNGNQKQMINCNFIECHQTYPGENDTADGTGQMGNVAGVRMVNCNFINTSSANHGGALCVADESNWGPGNIASTFINTNFINITSRWFAVYLHGNFSSSTAFITDPQVFDGCNFINCTGTGEYSGALGISHDGVQVLNCNFINCTGGQGGAIMVGGIKKDHDGFNGDNRWGNNVLIDNCVFNDNVAKIEGQSSSYSPGHGGARYYPTGNGGAVYVVGNDTRIINSIFNGNSAESGSGAAVYIEGQRTIIDNSEFYNHKSKNGTVYIVGNDVYIQNDCVFEDNTAENGAAVYIVGDNTHILNSEFENNNVTNQGGAVFINGDDSYISQNTFYKNNAIPQDNTSSGTTGLGGAFYVKGDNTQSGENNFTKNTARNGSAIYTDGNNFQLYWDTFYENQAWSYLLIVTPKPEESYYNESDVNITVCHVGGDNIINAIHNTAANNQITFNSVKYINSHGDEVTTGWGEHPVNGAEASQGGTITYQDDREYVQKIIITKIEDQDGNNILDEPYEAYTNITGEIRLTIKKPIKAGNYTVYAEHPEDWNYKQITNTSTFRVLPLVDLSTNKTSDKNKYYVGDLVVWTIKVSNAANATNATNVTLKDVLPSGFSFINASATKGSYSNATKLWTIGNLTNGTTVTLTINSRAINNGTYTNNVTVNCTERDWNESNNNANKTVVVYRPNMTVEKVSLNGTDFVVINDAVAFNITVTNTGDCNLTNVTVTEKYSAGQLTYKDHSDKGNWTKSGDVFTYQGNLTNGTSITFTIWFTAKTNGTLVNNVSAKSDETNGTNDTADVVVYSPNMTVEKISLNVTDFVVIGDTVAFNITVTNTGDCDLHNVIVTDEYSGDELVYVDHADKAVWIKSGDVYTLDALAKGANSTFTIWFTAKTNGTLVNNVSAKSDETNGTNDTADVVVYSPNMTVEKISLNTTNVNVNETVAFNITVTNVGDCTLNNVTVTDAFNPSEFAFVAYSEDKGWTRVGDSYVFNYGVPLANGTNATLTIWLKALTNGTLVNNVTAKSNQTNETNDTANVTVDPICDLVINKTVNASVINLNESVEWVITVTNNGPSVAKDVVVTDTLVDGLVLTGNSSAITVDGNVLTWNVGDMDPYTSRVLTIVTKATKEGKLNNTVVVTTTTNETNKTNNEANNTTQVDPICDLVINKTVNASVINLNESVSWTIVVTNNGPSVAKDVYVFDELEEGLELVGDFENVTKTSDGFIWYAGEIAPYTNVTLTVVTKATKEGNLTNKVDVVTSTNETNTTNNNASNSTQVDPICDVTITKEVNASELLYGESVEWTITVINNGPSVAKDVVVNDTLPVNATVVGKYDNCTIGDGILIWNVGDIEPYTSKVLKVITQLFTEGNNTNFVVVNTTTNETDYSNNDANNSTFVVSVADLTVNKTVSNASAHKGDVVEWTIAVTNNGPNAAVNVTVTDVIPGELIYDGIVRIDDGDFDGEIWSIKEVASGETLVLTIKTTVNATNTTIVNVVNVTSDTYDPNETNNNGTNETVIPPEADLEVIKAVLNESAHKGDVVEWIIAVINHGPDTAVNVVLDDILPKELIYNGTVGKPTAGEFDGKTWFIGNLTNGGFASMVIKTIVNTTNMSVVNKANVSSDTYDPDETNNNDSDVVVIPPEADLTVIKTVSNASAHKGDVVEWTIAVTNNGPDAVVNVTVTDVIPDELIYEGIVRIDDGDFDGEVWSIKEVASGETLVLTIKTTVNATNVTIVNVVNVTSDTYDPNETNNNGTNETVIPPEADLEVIKAVLNESAHKGDVVEWIIAVINHGPDTAVNVVLDDILPKELIYNGTVGKPTAGEFDGKTWFIGNLTNGGFASMVIKTIVNTTNMSVVNKANVSSDTYDPDETNNNDSDVVVIPPEADLEVIKVVINQTAHKGDVIEWIIAVVNHGPDTAVNVVLDDILPKELIYNGTVGKPTAGEFDGKTWFIGNLTNGGFASMVIKTIVNTTNMSVVNKANVSSDTYDPDETNNNDSDVIVIPPEADLSIIKTVSNASAHKGDIVTWTINVTNNGPDAAFNVTVVDVIPEELIYSAADVTVDRGEFKDGIWFIDEVASGETLVLTINTTVNATNATIVNNVNVTSDTYDPDETNNNGTNETVIPPEADLEAIITNDHEETPCHNGDEVIWTITVTNYGPDDAINTVLQDFLPEGLIYKSDDSEGAYDNETGVWTIGYLPVGKTVTLTITTLANTSNATITKNVSVSSDTYDPNLSNNNDSSSVDVIAEADLEIAKSVSNSTPHKDDKITWSIIVKNNGRDTAVNVVVSDKLPSGVVYLSDDSNGAYDYKTGIWTVGDIASGESKVLNIVTLVVDTNATIVNVANTTSDTYDPNETNNKCNNSTDVPPEVDLVLTIVPNVTDVTVGDKVGFTVTVENQGPDTAVNTVAFITLPEGLKLLNFEPSIGTYDPETGIWTIGDLAFGEKVTLLLDTEALVPGIHVVEGFTISDTYERNLDNNYDKAEVNVTEPETPAEPPVNVPEEKVPTMHATGNPIAMAILALLAVIGVSLRRKG